MTVPLVLLAIGTIVSWLGIGFLSRAYASFDLSEHGLTLSSFIIETFADTCCLDLSCSVSDRYRSFQDYGNNMPQTKQVNSP